MIDIKIRDVIAVLFLTFGLSGLAHSACLIGADTNASAVQADSGNGDYECSLTSTLKGIPLSPVPSVLADDWTVGDPPAVLVTLNPDGTLGWEVPTATDGTALVDVDLASMARNSGKRCNYVYAGDQAVEGDGLSTSDSGDVSVWTFCGDNQIGQTSQIIEPDTTVEDNCEVTFSLDGTPIDNPGLSLGYTKDRGDGYEGVQVCGTGQRQCINECVPRDPTTTSCAPYDDGSLPLGCAVCEWEYPDPVDSPKDLKYCSYWQNKVCVDGDEDNGCDTRAYDNSYMQSSLKKSLNASIAVTTGSDECLVTIGPLYGGLTYSYFISPCSP